MKVVVQRVKEGSVTVNGNTVASIGRGYVILLGIRSGDSKQDALFLAEKCSGLRVFEDQNGKMNLSLNEVDGSVLVVSQFTLYGDVQRGNRPSFTDAARPAEAEPLYDIFVNRMKELLDPSRVKTGIFKAMMDVHIVNDGPVTILIESK
ncbi:MAG: D-tyrosyl-tRNA(Tyr) deacylase [Ignavibacteriae bacterium]|nr:D-tyrosyl-tRNA(Tyr) deacylase [Ignavibacteriota bacterium]